MTLFDEHEVIQNQRASEARNISKNSGILSTYNNKHYDTYFDSEISQSKEQLFYTDISINIVIS